MSTPYFEVYKGWKVYVSRVGTKGEYTAAAFKDEPVPPVRIGKRISGKGAKAAAFLMVKKMIDEREGK